MARNQLKLLLVFLLVLTISFSLFVPTTYGQSFAEKTTRVGDPQTFSAGPKTQAPPVDPQNIRSEIRDKFGINMIGFGQQQMQWAWEKLWDVSHTNFVKLLHPKPTIININRINEGYSSQLGPTEINLKNYEDETLFKVIFIHELGHIIYWYNDDKISHQTEHNNLHKRGLSATRYGATDKTENYPEMITYYLNPGKTEQTLFSQAVVPFANGRNPEYFNLAKAILGDY